MDFRTQLKVAVYDRIVDTTEVPTIAELAQHLGASSGAVAAGLRDLEAAHILVLGEDGEIVMPSPFAARETEFRVEVGGKSYFANCVWDALAVPAALHRPGVVHARCGDCADRLRLEVGASGPEPKPWIAHFAVPAAHWRDDIFHT